MAGDSEGVLLRLAVMDQDGTQWTTFSSSAWTPSTSGSWSSASRTTRCTAPHSPSLGDRGRAPPIVVASGRTVRGALRVHNTGTEPIVIATNGQVTAQVLDPDTRVVVGGFAGMQRLPLIHFRAAPGDSVVVPVLVGTASFSPDLGYVVPAGKWAIQVILELEDENATGWDRGTGRPGRRRVRTPLLPITVTA
jgi:hypothetical protein